MAENNQTILSAEDLANELWLEVGHYREGYFPNYRISNMGRLRHKDRMTKNLKFVVGTIPGKEYYKTQLYNKGASYTVRIHQIVADKFIPNLNTLRTIVDHISGNIFDNRQCNLRWATPGENNANSRISSNNTSGVRGVSYVTQRDKFYATIQMDGEIERGYFDTLEEATLWRQEREIVRFDNFRRV